MDSIPDFTSVVSWGQIILYTKHKGLDPDFTSVSWGQIILYTKHKGLDSDFTSVVSWGQIILYTKHNGLDSRLYECFLRTDYTVH